MWTSRRNLAGALAMLVLAIPTLADAQSSCLQHNRTKGWRAIDDRTLVYRDVQDKEYIVRFRDTCRNLTTGGATLINRNWSGLSCLSAGDAFRVAARGTSVSTCRVESVQGAPETAGR